MKKTASVVISAFVAMMLMSFAVCAEEIGVGASSGMNVPTGVQVQWLPVIIAAAVLVVVGIVSLIITTKKKKK